MKKRTADEAIRRAAGTGVARNMAGVTDAEARKALDGQAVGCLTAVVCGALLALIAAGWVIYVICCRHPLTDAEARQTAGDAGDGYSICESCGMALDASNAHAVCIPEMDAGQVHALFSALLAEDDLPHPMIFKTGSGRTLTIVNGIVTEEGFDDE